MTESSVRVDYEFDKLRAHEDLAPRRGEIRQALSDNDPGMLRLMPGPLNNGKADQRNWRKAESETTTMIVHNLVSVAEVRCRDFKAGSDADERTDF